MWARLGTWISQSVNVWLGLIPPLKSRGFGDPDETVSSVSGKLTERGSKAARIFCRFLSLFDEHHCKEAIERDEGSGQKKPSKK